MNALGSDKTHTKQTDYIRGTVNPTWNTNLNFGCRSWEKFLILQVWDSDYNADDPISKKQKITLSPGNHQDNRREAYSSGYMIFDYNFVVDSEECSTNPCWNGGTCVDGCASYTCHCAPSYRRTHCEQLSGNLRVKARYGRNLSDRDPWLNDSDPYMKVIAVDTQS